MLVNVKINNIMKKSSKKGLYTKPATLPNPAGTPGKNAKGTLKPDNKSVGSKIGKLHK